MTCDTQNNLHAPQLIDANYMGYAITLAGGISYQCVALKLRGYATERAVKSAVRKELRKRGKI